MKSKDYYSYLDILRVLAVMAVITIHVSGHVLFDVSILSAKWWIANVYNACSRWCIPVFVMISGALILNNDYSSIGHFLLKRFKRVALPGIFWVIIYYLFSQTVSKQPLDFSYLIKIILQLHDSKGLSYHLWYIPLILGLYMAAPVIKVFISKTSNKTMYYFLFVWFLFSSFFPFIKTIFHISIGIEPTIFVLYVGYFILGYFLHNSTFKIQNYAAIFLFIVGSACTSLGMFYLSSKLGRTEAYFLGYGTPNVILMSVSIFLLVKNMNIRFHESSFLKNIGDTVFGIFLIHIIFLNPLIYAYGRLFNPVEKIGPLFGIPISVFFVFFLSLFAVVLLKKFPVTKHTV